MLNYISTFNSHNSPRGALHCHPHLIDEHVGKLDTHEGRGDCPIQWVAGLRFEPRHPMPRDCVWNHDPIMPLKLPMLWGAQEEHDIKWNSLKKKKIYAVCFKSIRDVWDLVQQLGRESGIHQGTHQRTEILSLLISCLIFHVAHKIPLTSLSSETLTKSTCFEDV